jgi:nucleotide-binding universal stress UspA family protein
MYETILVPLDGSKRAEKILPHVEGLATCLGSKLIFLDVVSPVYLLMDPMVSYVDIDATETKALVAEAKGYLESLARKFEGKNIRVMTKVEQGPVVETIIEIARNEQADLIAMASHGRSGMGRVFYGSVAAGVLQRVDRPLLLVRSRDED